MRQQTINAFTVVKPRPPPPVTKVGLKEYLLELVVDADLVRILDSPLMPDDHTYVSP
jgi:hypothetical protein